MPRHICSAGYLKRGGFPTKYLVLVELFSISPELSGTVLTQWSILLHFTERSEIRKQLFLNKSFPNSHLLEIQSKKVEKGMSGTEKIPSKSLEDLRFGAWAHQCGEH